jgi:hypothetical protein
VNTRRFKTHHMVTTNTKLDRSLGNCPGSGIVIGADDITLNLAGHTIDGDGVLGNPAQCTNVACG